MFQNPTAAVRGGRWRSGLRMLGDTMSKLTFELLRLEKTVPLTISRGTSTHAEIFWLRWFEEGAEGWGEAVPFAIDERPQPMAAIVAAFDQHASWLQAGSAWKRQEIDRRLREADAPSAFIAAVNQALYDWMGKRVGQPVSRLLGLGEKSGALTFATVGISSPEDAVLRVKKWRDAHDVRAFKVKLGSRAGVEADKAMFAAVRAVVPDSYRMSVDANGGWTPETAVAMAVWLAGQGVDHVEQPLPRGLEHELGAVQAESPLPIFVDESCRTVADLPALVGKVSGINIKLMKCGGLDGALRLLHAARAHDMRILVGCYGSSALGNGCALTLAPLVDRVDLDSHLNLKDDPFGGWTLKEGLLAPTASPGFGISHAKHSLRS